MKGIRQWNPRGRIAAMTILAFALLLTGCGKGTAKNGESTAESTGESKEQTVSVESADIEDSETADKTEETSGRFQYDYTKLYGGWGGLPIIEEEQAKADGKTILTLQTFFANPWLKEAIAGFNRQSTDYFISLSETDDYESDRVRMSIEIMAGRGPDIITEFMFEPDESILKKGVLLDLAPGLDALGITDEEYFPSVRALCVEDGVYGICPVVQAQGFWIRESVLGSKEQPDIETLVEKLYTYPDQEAVWRPYARSVAILECLLSGSEDLWGVIDWENGTCDFSGELFAKMLEIAKRYADPEAKSLEAEEKWTVSYYTPTWQPRKQLESEGKVIFGFVFDDGNYPYNNNSGNDVLMLNANSKHQEGAWEFLEYLLGEEGQGYAAGSGDSSANKEMFRSYYEYQQKLVEEGKLQTTGDLSSDAIEELYAYAEQARYLPFRTRDILDIIYEEAQTYCDGDKPLEDVCNIIQRRVQLYISERM